MDRVFEKSQPDSPGSTKLKRILLGKQKWQSPVKKEPQYFPYGGGGDSVDDLASQFDSYEPEELMVDSHVPIEESSLKVLKRNARKILVTGSKYDVPDILAPPNSRHSSHDPHFRMTAPETSRSSSAKSHLPIPSSDGIVLPPMLKTIAQAVDFVRGIARASILLKPLDSLVDSSDDSWASVAIAVTESWLLMLALSLAAHLVQILCMPSVWLLRLLFYIVK